jgi:hypothetical protein
MQNVFPAVGVVEAEENIDFSWAAILSFPIFAALNEELSS